MNDFVTGTPAVVGFTNGYGRHDDGEYEFNDIFHAHHLTHGISEVRADLCKAAGDTHVAIEKIGAANALATEKIGASNLLATEKIGAASILAAEKIGAASLLAVERTASENRVTVERTANANHLATVEAEHRTALTLADMRAEAAKCCCEIKELVRAENGATRELVNRLDSDNAKVALQNATAELLALKYRTCNNGNGNGNND